MAVMFELRAQLACTGIRGPGVEVALQCVRPIGRVSLN